MNAAIHPLQFDLFNTPVATGMQKTLLTHHKSTSRHGVPTPSRKSFCALPCPSPRVSRQFHKVVAMANAHAALGMHERSLILLTTLVAIDAAAAGQWYDKLPAGHRIRSLWQAFGAARAAFAPAMFSAYAVLAEPCLRLSVTAEDIRQDQSGMLESACKRIRARIDAGLVEDAVRLLAPANDRLTEHYAARMATVRLQAQAKRPGQAGKQASTL